MSNQGGVPETGEASLNSIILSMSQQYVEEKKHSVEIKETPVTYNAVAIRNLYKTDIEPLLWLAEECLLNNLQETKVEYDWLRQLNAAYYAMGGDYPDEEGVEHAEQYASSCLDTVSAIITKLSRRQLNQCISDMNIFMEKLP